MTCSKESPTAPVDVVEQAYDGDGEADFYFPQIMQDRPYPTITIVKDMPCTQEVEESSGETTLNPNAQPFLPSGGEENLDIESKHVQVDGGNEEEEVASLAGKEETNLPENTLEEYVENSPDKEQDSEAMMSTMMSLLRS